MLLPRNRPPTRAEKLAYVRRVKGLWHIANLILIIALVLLFTDERSIWVLSLVVGDSALLFVVYWLAVVEVLKRKK